jgi:hypothetical protein
MLTDIENHLAWIFSGLGLFAIERLTRRMSAPRRSKRSLTALVGEIRSRSFATQQARALQETLGNVIYFDGRVLSADGTRPHVAIGFRVKRCPPVRCVFERDKFPEIGLVTEGDKLRVHGTIVGATRHEIKVVPSSFVDRRWRRWIETVFRRL